MIALRLRPPARPALPQGYEIAPVAMLLLAAVGVAAAFVPSWDSYTLQTSSGVSQTVTAGYAFANPAAVIAGNVAVMAGLVVVVAAAAAWRPVRFGAALLAGAIAAMAAQAISALVMVGQSVSPAQFGFTPAQASQAGLTISAGAHPGVLDLLHLHRRADRVGRLDAAHARRARAGRCAGRGCAIPAADGRNAAADNRTVAA